MRSKFTVHFLQPDVTSKNSKKNIEAIAKFAKKIGHQLSSRGDDCQTGKTRSRPDGT